MTGTSSSHSLAASGRILFTGGLGALGTQITHWLSTGRIGTDICLLGRTGHFAGDLCPYVASDAYITAASCDVAAAEDCSAIMRSQGTSGNGLQTVLHAGTEHIASIPIEGCFPHNRGHLPSRL